MSWEVDWEHPTRGSEWAWARNPTSKCRASREWHETGVHSLRRAGIDTRRCTGHGWEVDWTHPKNTGSKVWARNPRSPRSSARLWHWVMTGWLRTQGVSTPTFRADSWEVDWTRRRGKQVWARNLLSKGASARAWHWVDYRQMQRSGIRWRPKSPRNGRWVSSSGYVMLSRVAMTAEDIAVAETHGLFKGRDRTTVWEHQLVAVKKYGAIGPGRVVRHLNGVKTDNCPENLLLGTTQENTLDHDTARRMLMYWRERCERAEGELARLQRA